MKYKIETVIPQRQYENIHITYLCDTEEEKEKAIEYALNDLRKYNGVIARETPLPFYKPKEGQQVECGGNVFTFSMGKWSFKPKE